MTQAGLALKACVSASYISRLERAEAARQDHPAAGVSWSGRFGAPLARLSVSSSAPGLHRSCTRTEARPSCAFNLGSRWLALRDGNNGLISSDGREFCTHPATVSAGEASDGERVRMLALSPRRDKRSGDDNPTNTPVDPPFSEGGIS